MNQPFNSINYNNYNLNFIPNAQGMEKRPFQVNNNFPNPNPYWNQNSYPNPYPYSPQQPYPYNPQFPNPYQNFPPPMQQGYGQMPPPPPNYMNQGMNPINMSQSNTLEGSQTGAMKPQ